MTKIVKMDSPFLPINNLVLLTTVDQEGKPYIMTIGSVGFNCTNPPAISIALRPKARVYRLIEEVKEFVVNFPTIDLVWDIDFCGSSKLRRDKLLEKTGLTPIDGKFVKSPLIQECPVNMECKLKMKVKLGVSDQDHDLFISEVVATHIDEEVLGSEGDIDFRKAKMLTSNGRSHEYWTLGEPIGSDGISKIKPNPRLSAKSPS